MVIFLTGEQQVGKSTIISKFIKAHPELKLGGYFTVHDTEEIIMKPAANPDSKGYVVGIKKTCGYPEVFEKEGVEILQASKVTDLIILDEVGWMESKALNFSNEILSIIKSGKNVLGVLRKDLDTELAKAIKQEAEVIEVSPSNRDQTLVYIEMRYKNEV